MPVEVSVIIPTHNGADRIHLCLSALTIQTTRYTYEIIVIDDGSTDNTEKVVAKFENIKLFRQNNNGPASARNLGVHKALGDIILFTDDDCIPQNDWIEKMVTPFNNSSVMGVCGVYRSSQKSLVAGFVQIEYEEKYSRMLKSHRIDLAATYSAAFRKTIFLELGGFDTSFNTASVEDRDFSVKFENNGNHIIFVREAIVWHKHASTLGAYLKKKYKNGYWGMLLLRMNPSILKGTSDTPFTQLFQIAAIILLILSLTLLLFESWVKFIPLAIMLTFFGSMAPLVKMCFQKKMNLGFYAPLMISLRALGLGMGFVIGFLSFTF